jgi:hypothetical protein
MNSIFLRAVVFSLAFILPRLLLSRHDPAIFDDWDEPFYLILAREFGSVGLNQLSLAFPQTPQEIISIRHLYSHNLVDLIVGRACHWLGFDLLHAFLLLDFCCLFLSYLLLTRLYALLSLGGNKIIAEVAAVVGILNPYWIGQVELLLREKIFFFEPSSVTYFPSIPALRGLYTQISFPLFLLTLLLTQQWNVLQESTRLSRLIICGALAGLTIYIYSFAWITLTTLITVLGLLVCITSKSITPLKRTIVLNLINALLAAPGFFLSLKMKSFINTVTPQRPDPYLPFSFLAIVILFYLLLPRLASKDERLKFWIIALSVSDILLSNLDFITSSIWTTYHFSLFYLRPILSGLLIYVFLSYFRVMTSSRPSQIALFLIMAFFLSLNWIKVQRLSDSRSEETAAITMVTKYVAAKQMIGLNHFDLESKEIPSDLLLPFWIDSMANTSSWFLPDGLPYYSITRLHPVIQSTLTMPGIIPEFCRSEMYLQLQTSKPLIFWLRRPAMEECKAVKEDIFNLCRGAEWDWYPNFLLLRDAEFGRVQERLGDTAPGILSVVDRTSAYYLLRVENKPAVRDFVCAQSEGA